MKLKDDDKFKSNDKLHVVYTSNTYINRFKIIVNEYSLFPHFHKSTTLFSIIYIFYKKDFNDSNLLVGILTSTLVFSLCNNYSDE